MHCQAQLVKYVHTGSNPVDVDTWMVVQQNVDAFTVNATKCAKKMGSFVKILNKEDISMHKNRDTIREVGWAERPNICLAFDSLAVIR